MDQQGAGLVLVGEVQPDAGERAMPNTIATPERPSLMPWRRATCAPMPYHAQVFERVFAFIDGLLNLYILATGAV